MGGQVIALHFIILVKLEQKTTSKLTTRRDARPDVRQEDIRKEKEVLCRMTLLFVRSDGRFDHVDVQNTML